jgi:hypothetical protein
MAKGYQSASVERYNLDLFISKPILQYSQSLKRIKKFPVKNEIPLGGLNTLVSAPEPGFEPKVHIPAIIVNPIFA